MENYLILTQGKLQKTKISKEVPARIERKKERNKKDR